MKITLLSPSSLRLEPAPPPLTIEALTAEQSYTPFHMLASGLAVCTWTVLHSWAQHAKLGADGLALELDWSFAEKPHRIGSIRVRIEWPDLPGERAAAARRVARMCAVHNTLTHPPEIDIGLLGDDAAPPLEPSERPE
jgi:uncharacterized OsmC-like protein